MARSRLHPRRFAVGAYQRRELGAAVLEQLGEGEELEGAEAAELGLDEAVGMKSRSASNYRRTASLAAA